MFNRKNRKRGLFTAMSLTLVAALGFAGAPAAMGDQGIDLGNMPDGPFKLIVHKYDSTNSNPGIAHDGTQQDVPNTALSGVKFKVTKIKNFNLDDNGFWAKVKDLNFKNNQVSDGSVNYELDATKSQEKPTLVDGSATFDKLEKGVYLVQETSFGEHKVTKAVDPFFVTLPFPNKDRGWLSEVNVYPKNDLNTGGKKENTNSNNLRKIGDKVEWAISFEVKKNPSKLGVVDKLEEYLSLDVQDSKAVSVRFGQIDLVPADYKVTQNKKYAGVNAVQIELTPGGLKKINKDGTIIFTLRTTLTKLPSNSGAVSNSAFPIDNSYDPFNEPQSPNQGIPPEPPINVPDPAKPVYGQYQFIKTDSSKTPKPLSGAVFEVCKDSTCADVVYTDLKSDDHGVVNIPGLFIGIGTDKLTQTYWIREKTAPKGFVLDTTIREITVKAGAHQPNEGVAVVNTIQQGPNLPMTGAAGTVLLTLAGVAVFAIATGLAFVNKRRKNA
ncbi:SpaH/EbpB family LPXTG-anchored major pilin [Arcanobacterium phocae]|uniref:SpaH/EbpB family LPXTG-anchored major pilin n=1 Tax=Arcanobacterium phocae TaxID=131112 RepID=UPI001C0F2848